MQLSRAMRTAWVVCLASACAALQPSSLARPARRLELHSEAGEEGGLNPVYPALSDEEVVEMLDKVPVFTLADGEGNAAVVNDGTTKALEFYCDVEVAMARKKMFDDEKLRVTASSLGRAVVAYKDSETVDGIKARFMADPRESIAARQIILRGASEEGAQKASADMSSEELLAAYKLADPDGRFAEPTDVPLFSIEQLMLARDGGPGMRPWFFSLKDLLVQWKNASETDESYADGEVQILSLNEMIQLMQSESPTDNRARLFVPSMASLKAIGAQ